MVVVLLILPLEYKDVYDIALIRGLQIPNCTTDELTKLPPKIPKMQEVIIHSLNTKLRKINRNYPWSMPDCLKNRTNNYFPYHMYSICGCYDLS